MSVDGLGVVGVFMNLLKFFARFSVNICFLPANRDGKFFRSWLKSKVTPEWESQAPICFSGFISHCALSCLHSSYSDTISVPGHTSLPPIQGHLLMFPLTIMFYVHPSIISIHPYFFGKVYLTPSSSIICHLTLCIPYPWHLLLLKICIYLSNSWLLFCPDYKLHRVRTITVHHRISKTLLK